METIGQKLARIRREMGFKRQNEFAKAIGYDPASISKVETDERSPSDELIIKYLEKLENIKDSLSTKDYARIKNELAALLKKDTKISNIHSVGELNSLLGIRPTEKCLIVINHNPRGGYGMMSHDDILAVHDLTKMLCKAGVESDIAPFDQILEKPGAVVEFCIGAPAQQMTGNQRTGVHLENFLKGIRFLPWESNNPESLTIWAGNEKFVCVRGQSEYVILAKFYPAPSAYPVFLICGQTSTSNRSAIYYLAQGGSSIREQEQKSSRFCLLLHLVSSQAYGYKNFEIAKDLTDVAFTAKST